MHICIYLATDRGPADQPPAELTAAPTSNTWTDDIKDALATDWSWINEDPTHWDLTPSPVPLKGHNANRWVLGNY